MSSLLSRDTAHHQSLKTSLILLHDATSSDSFLSSGSLRLSQDRTSLKLSPAYVIQYTQSVRHVDQSTLCATTNYLRALYRMSRSARVT